MIISDQVVEAKVVDVLWTPSKDGLLKPRIQIEPVTIGGAKIEYATAFNAKFVEDNKIGVGAVVRLIRSGDVIPHIAAIVTPASQTLMPKQEYEWNETHVDIVLKNKEDDETVKIKTITKFFKTLEVDKLGEANIKKIVNTKADTIAKIINLSKDDLKEVENLQEKIPTQIYYTLNKQNKQA